MNENQVNSEEQELLQKFRLLSQSSRNTVMSTIIGFAANEVQDSETSTCTGIAQSAEGNEVLAETN